MEQYKVDFIECLISNDALKITNPDDPEKEGLFTLKSGRRSPFFMNLGAMNNGKHLNMLGKAYAQAIVDHFDTDFDVVFGPAYKGIPIAVATAMSLFDITGVTFKYCADRKEVKDHGDGGNLVGADLRYGNSVVIVEDVTTSGQSIDEVMPKITNTGAYAIGLVVSLDRMEVGKYDRSKTALEEISDRYPIDTYAIVTMQEVYEYLHEHGRIDARERRLFKDYYKRYGPEGRFIV